jgi:hypothetical protein
MIDAAAPGNGDLLFLQNSQSEHRQTQQRDQSPCGDV